MANTELLLFKGSKGHDITDLVEQIKWGGRKGSSSRYLEATLLDDENLTDARADIDVEDGRHCIFNYDGEELFRGIIMRRGQTNKKTLSFKAYDNGIYLANNKDTFTYSDKTASFIFKDICNRFGIPFSSVAETSHRIPELVKAKTTAFDALCDALSQEFKNTGQRYYVDSKKDSLRLLKRQEHVLKWVLEVGQNITSYNSTVSIEKVRTRIKLLSDEGKVLAEKKDTALEAKIGIMQDVQEPDETLNDAQLQALVNTLLGEVSAAERSLKVSALGQTQAISGVGIFTTIPALGIKKTFYVDEDVHIFKGNYHSMQLTLNHADDYEFAASAQEKKSSDSNGNKKKSYLGRKVGDTVNFAGGNQYHTPNSTTATGGIKDAGAAKITQISADAKHPFHVVGGKYNELGGECNVYGWVDASAIS